MVQPPIVPRTTSSVSDSIFWAVRICACSSFVLSRAVSMTPEAICEASIVAARTDSAESVPVKRPFASM